PGTAELAFPSIVLDPPEHQSSAVRVSRSGSPLGSPTPPRSPRRSGPRRPRRGPELRGLLGGVGDPRGEPDRDTLTALDWCSGGSRTMLGNASSAVPGGVSCRVQPTRPRIRLTR